MEKHRAHPTHLRTLLIFSLTVDAPFFCVEHVLREPVAVLVHKFFQNPLCDDERLHNVPTEAT